jgi:hypothetical protein
MPFGLKNAPAIFSRVVVEAFQEFLHKFLKAYFDDWIVFSLLKNHIECLRLMLDKCIVITLKCTIQVYLASGLLMPLPSQSHAEQILKKSLKTSNPRPNFSLGAGNRLLSFYCTRVSAG